MAEGDEHSVGQGCGCKLCKTPFKVKKLTDEERREKELARKDWQRYRHELEAERNRQLGFNGTSGDSI